MRRSLWLTIWLSVLATSVDATGLKVSPPHIRLSPGQMTAEVRLTNAGAVAISVQASAQRWQQDAAGLETESEAVDLVLYPKVFVVQPGTSQIVRVGRIPSAPMRPATEMAYRLTLRELPVENGENTIAITRRLRLPVWLEPVTPKSEWDLSGLAALAAETASARPQDRASHPAPKPRLAAEVMNRGNVHLRLVDIHYAALSATGEVKAETVTSGWYVLAGSRKAFPADFPAGFCANANTVRVTARTADGSRTADWPAEALCAGKS